ncbi:MAG: hypothetical protein AAB306_04985 [Pseudomonadota bacterium]
MRYLILILLLIIPIAAPAGTETEIRHLEKTMARVLQESQFTYQQFLMIQELRRIEMLEAPVLIPPNPPGKSIPIPNHADMNRLRQEKNERIEQYTTDLNRLYTRYKTLENEREVILEQIKRLEQKPTEE